MANRREVSAEPRTRRSILDLLKRDGPQTAEALAATLDVTAMAVRQHLYELAEQKLVEFDVAADAGTVGRPAKLWRVTRDADRYFPDAHAELTVGLIDAMESAFGPHGLDKMLQFRTRQVFERYRRDMPAAHAPIAQKLRALAKLRTQDGYMAAVEKDADGTLLLVENHCPICAAAAACQGLCASELELFEKLLGPDVRVHRIDHIQANARRCAYRIEPRKRD
jgi:predicted ArsR family transcriptional regulator